MFNEMLSKEKIEPRKMGFDRPSPKFLNFLNKYYDLNDYVPQNNNYVVFKDYFKDVPAKRDKYDIYNNYNYNSDAKNNYNNYYRNIPSQRKLGRYSRGNDNENSNSSNEKTNVLSQKDKDFTTRIYKEYYNSTDEPKTENNEDNNYKYNHKKSFGYNQYQSTSSEYGAFFHMNK